MFRDNINLIATRYCDTALPTCQPVRVGIPFAQNVVPNERHIHVQATNGPQVPYQVKTLSRWADGSVRWALVEFCWQPAEQFQVVVSEHATELNERFSAQKAVVFPQISNDGSLLLCHTLIDREFPVLVRLGHDGMVFHGQIRSMEQQDVGPLRFSWTGQVAFTNEHVTSPLEGQLTLHTYSSHGVAEFELCIRNPQAMDHPGGNWDLGAKGALFIDELSVELVHALPDGPDKSELKLHLEEADQILTGVNELRIFQASSGGENWSSRNHIDRHGNVPMSFCGYEILADGRKHHGKRAQPMLTVEGQEFCMAVAYRQFWQNFPKTLAANRETLKVGLFPIESGYQHELQGGEQKTHEFAFEIVGASETITIDWYRQPIHIGLAPSDYALRQAIPYLTTRCSAGDPCYEGLVDQAIQGDDTFFAKREKIDEYGWRNFGDIYGDHEAVFEDGPSPLISHYNNQYDCTAGFAFQYLRTGDVRWYTQMVEMADHAWDIDTYHTSNDKLLYNGGLFWHTYHYADTDSSAHRSYPRRLLKTDKLQKGQDLSELGETGRRLAKIYAVGGGPAPAHNYSTGWMIAYWLTGKERYRTAAINAADYVLNVEDGSQTPFRWLSRSNTGHSTCSSDGYHGPGRAAGNSTHALLTGYELTGDDKYLKQAALLMRRTVHPEENLDKLDLLNAELRWFYTMYLQALGRFADTKLSLGQSDDDVRYGVTSLLHYANWMQQNERPTLSQPKDLQYPNETWAAQDMRKWHVLEHAALYEPDLGKRRALRDKADYFYNDVCKSLEQFTTKSLCRPVVLMLNFGWQRNWFLRNRDAIQATQDIMTCFPKRTRFTPQRDIAVTRLKRLAMTAVIIGALFVGACLFWRLRP